MAKKLMVLAVNAWVAQYEGHNQYRIIEMELTPEQEELIKPKSVGMNGSAEIHESIVPLSIQ